MTIRTFDPEIKIKQRSYSEQGPLWDAEHLSHLCKRIYAARGVKTAEDVDYPLSALPNCEHLMGMTQALDCLYKAFQAHKRVMIIGDFDTDGATSTALAVHALKTMGLESVDYLVPNRFEYGYGLTPEIVEVAKKNHPDLLITVDNGISSCAGVETAIQSGIEVLITDHHLPGHELPAASAIVNPNQRGCPFPSKALAGVGVIFYVMLGLRRHLDDRHWFETQGIVKPNMAQYLDLVALGTVADVVPLDYINRVLVHQGLKRMRSGFLRPGIQALLTLGKRDVKQLASADLGFAVAPRLNAAGRLDDMSLGIACLLSETFESAMAMAQSLDALNQKRQSIEKNMTRDVEATLDYFQTSDKPLPSGLCLYHETWHQGVIGILAGRLKERLHRPVIAFAKASADELKGSARSILALNMRDALDAIATAHPGLIHKFGGHAMAAGLSLPIKHLHTFAQAFDAYVTEQVPKEALSGEYLTDGVLQPSELSLTTVFQLHQAGPWGQLFPEPLFEGLFKVLSKQSIGRQHLKLMVQMVQPDHPEQLENSPALTLEAMLFHVDLKQFDHTVGQTLRLVYRLSKQSYRGPDSVQLIIEHLAQTH